MFTVFNIVPEIGMNLFCYTAKLFFFMATLFILIYYAQCLLEIFMVYT